MALKNSKKWREPMKIEIREGFILIKFETGVEIQNIHVLYGFTVSENLKK